MDRASSTIIAVERRLRVRGFLPGLVAQFGPLPGKDSHCGRVASTHRPGVALGCWARTHSMLNKHPGGLGEKILTPGLVTRKGKQPGKQFFT